MVNRPTVKLTSQRTPKGSYITEDLKKITLNYPELVHFMANIAREEPNDDLRYRASKLYRGKEVHNDYRWEISFMYRGNYKYCENIQRHHRRNNI